MVVTALSQFQVWKDCGLQKMDQLPPANAIADAIIDLNMLIDAWGIEKGMRTMLWRTSPSRQESGNTR